MFPAITTFHTCQEIIVSSSIQSRTKVSNSNPYKHTSILQATHNCPGTNYLNTQKGKIKAAFLKENRVARKCTGTTQ